MKAKGQLDLPMTTPRRSAAPRERPTAEAPEDQHVFTGEGCEPIEGAVIPAWLRIPGLDDDPR